MKIKVPLNEEQLKEAAANWATRTLDNWVSIGHVTLHLDRPTNPTPTDQGLGFYAEVEVEL